MTKSQKVAADITALLRARNPLLWIVTREEARVEGYLVEAAGAAKYIARTWDVAAGACEIGGNPVRGFGDTQDPGAILQAISTVASRTSGEERVAWILRDLPVWLQGPGAAATLRSLRNLTRKLPGVPRNSSQAVIILSPNGDVPPELAGSATVIEWPLPDREEIGALLDAAYGAALSAAPDKIKPLNGLRDAAIDAAVGLSGEEAQACYAKSIVQSYCIDPLLIAQEKKRVVTREKVLEWIDPIPGGLDAVGGLDAMKVWLKQRTLAYSPQARAYGLPAPKGVLLVGVPGCGKSLTAKAVATAYGVPLLRFDIGALKSKFVGESEGNIRKARAVVEAIGRCVVWIDELEKALQGATSGSSDGGVSSDALGFILSWMQDRTSEAFFVATANDVSVLPPELLRKGRWDELFFVDLPTPTERVSVLSAALAAHGRRTTPINKEAVSKATSGFAGAEIAALVPEALFAAFADDGREVTTEDLINAAANVVPLGKTMSEKIGKLREWAKERARPATAKVAITEVGSNVRALDL